MSTAFESKTNFPTGTIEYIVQHLTHFLTASQRAPTSSSCESGWFLRLNLDPENSSNSLFQSGNRFVSQIINQTESLTLVLCSNHHKLIQFNSNTAPRTPFCSWPPLAWETQSPDRPEDFRIYLLSDHDCPYDCTDFWQIPDETPLQPVTFSLAIVLDMIHRSFLPMSDLLVLCCHDRDCNPLNNVTVKNKYPPSPNRVSFRTL